MNNKEETRFKSSSSIDYIISNKMKRAQSSRLLTSANKPTAAPLTAERRRSPPNATSTTTATTTVVAPTLTRSQTTLRRPTNNNNNSSFATSNNHSMSTYHSNSDQSTMDNWSFNNTNVPTSSSILPPSPTRAHHQQQQQQQQGASSPPPQQVMSSARRSKKISELDTAAHFLAEFFSSAQDIYNHFHEEKHQVFLNEIYEIAFIGVLTKREAVVGSGDDDGGSSTPVANRHNNKEFSNFIRDQETKDALKLGESAISMLQGGSTNNGDTSSFNHKQQHQKVVDEFKEQVEFWKSVAQSTHKHNGMLLEAKKMLEGSALRSAQLQKDNQSLNDEIKILQSNLDTEVERCKKIASERQSYIEQLGNVATQLQKSQKKVEIFERQAVAAKRDKEKETNTVAEKEKQIHTAQSQLRQANAAVEMLTASLNSEREQHNHVKHLYDKIINHRKTESCQTEMSGPFLLTEEFLWEFAESKLRTMFETYQSALFVACSDATKAKQDCQVYKTYTETALNAVDEAKRIETNKDASWNEQVRQLKREAEAECRRADEQKKKSQESVNEGEKLKAQLLKLQTVIDTKYDVEKKLRSGAAKHISTQSEMTFDGKTGNRRALNTISMSSQTNLGWFSTLSVEANHRITEEMRLEKMQKILSSGSSAENGNGDDENNDDADAGLNTSSSAIIAANKTSTTSTSAATTLSNSAVPSDNMLPATIISGRKAKDQIAVSRESVRKILSGGLSSLSSQQLQRKELLNSIRALSEAVTLSAGHIKDLEGEIERIVHEHFAAKPSTDQSVAATTDNRGNLIVDGGVVFVPMSSSSSKIKNDVSTSASSATTQQQPQQQLRSPSQKLDFGYVGGGGGNSASLSTNHHNMPISPIRRQQDASSTSQNSSSVMKPQLVSHYYQNMKGRNDDNNYSEHKQQFSSSSSPSTFDYHNNSMKNPSNKNPAVLTSSSSVTRRVSMFGDENNNCNENGNDTNSSGATNLQKLLDRGESLEQQPFDNSSNNNNFSRRASLSATTARRGSSAGGGALLSKIDAVQKQTQKILDESSPLALARRESSVNFADYVTKEKSSSSSSPSGGNRRKGASSNSNKKPEWNSIPVAVSDMKSQKLKKEAEKQASIQRRKQLPSELINNNNNTALDSSPNSSAGNSRSSSSIARAHYAFEKDLRRQIYQEEQDAFAREQEEEGDVGSFHHIEDSQRNPYAREFYDHDYEKHTLVAAENNSSLRGDDRHQHVGGESSALRFPYRELSQRQQRDQLLQNNQNHSNDVVVGTGVKERGAAHSGRNHLQDRNNSSNAKLHFSPTKFSM